MPGDNPERQSLIARESDLLLEELERLDNEVDFDRDTAEVRKEKAWRDHLRARPNVLDEELHELQGIRNPQT